MKITIKTVVTILVITAIAYGATIMAKNVSYSLFYKDMVKETIQEMVREEALK